MSMKLRDYISRLEHIASTFSDDLDVMVEGADERAVEVEDPHVAHLTEERSEFFRDHYHESWRGKKVVRIA